MGGRTNYKCKFTVFIKNVLLTGEKCMRVTGRASTAFLAEPSGGLEGRILLRLDKEVGGRFEKVRSEKKSGKAKHERVLKNI